MKKVIFIKGMTCGHCEQRVSRALNSIDGVKAQVSYKKGQAAVRLSEEISDEQLKEAIRSEGYELTEVKEKKGLLGG